MGEVFPEQKAAKWLLPLAVILIGIWEGLIFALSMVPAKSLKTGIILTPFWFSAAYCLGEWMQTSATFLPFGWGRMSLALAQPAGLLFAQPAATFGGFFLSMFLAFVNGLIAEALTNTGTMRRLAIMTLPYTFLANFTITILENMLSSVSFEDTISVSAIQTDFPGSEKWTTSSEILLEKCIQLTENSRKSEVYFWPETSISLDGDESIFYMQNLAKTLNADIVFGTTEQTLDGYYNSATGILSDGSWVKPYYKRILVPFGEYLPMEKLAIKAIPMLKDYSFFNPGREYKSLELSSISTGIAICYESVFPGLVRKQMQDNLEMLAFISNDSWFGNSTALVQLHANVAMRAIENRRYVIRSGNAMLSEILTPYGNVVTKLDPGSEGSVSSDVMMCNGKTLYTQYGELWLLIITIYGVFQRAKLSLK